MAMNLLTPTRRALLLGAGALFSCAYLPRVAQAEGDDPRFIAIVLRSGLDGLAIVAPVGDPDWPKLRGDKALTLDGPSPALPRDGFFALNPAMPNLHRLYRAGQALVVHAVATPYPERSHLDGQDVLESGMAGPGAVRSGWLNRAISALGSGQTAAALHRQAFAVGPITPLVIRGPVPVQSWMPPRLPRPATTRLCACSTSIAILTWASPGSSKNASRSPRWRTPAAWRKKLPRAGRPSRPVELLRCGLFRRGGRHGGEIPRPAQSAASGGAGVRRLGHAYQRRCRKGSARRPARRA